MEVVIFALIFAAGAIYSAYAAWAKAQRREDFAHVAGSHGLQYSEGDPFDCTRVAFGLFRKGDGRGAENVLWRDGSNDLPVRGFDYWYYDERRDENGQVRKSYSYFSCVLAQVNSSWPSIRVEREGVLDKVAGALGFDDIDFESDEFNRLFAVRCQDRRFAMALIDPRMMEFLLTTEARFDFEIKGRWLLLETTRVKPSLVPALMRVCDTFIERIPPVVWDLFPTPFVDAEGNPLPAVDELAVRRVDDEPDDPFDALLMSPFAGFRKHDDDEHEPEYDLDGNIIHEVEQDPWRDLPGDKPT